MHTCKEPIPLPLETRPILTPVIHTEEEFDWEAEHDRNATGVSHMRHIHRAQDIFDAFGLRPTYVIDYPIASKEEAYGPLKQYADSGRAEIGAHLHPWVSPPHLEEVNRFNSYPGNLSLDLEYEKLAALTEQIKLSLGSQPKSYLAGRYGFGPNTGQILDDLGYEVDISPAIPLDFRADGGPDYSAYSSHPFWFGERRRLLGLPGTGAYVGRWQALGTPFYRAVQQPWARKVRLPGVLSRLRLFERLRLSPEDYSLEDMKRLTLALLKQGCRHFVFSFHSPTVMPGGTPYVKNDADLKRFLDACSGYCQFFTETLRGQGMTALEFKAYAESLQGASKT
jgi:hypothetical protein